MNIGNNIAKLRKEKDLTQEDLAKLINVSAKTISGYETNRNLPSIETLINLSEILEVPVDTILNITKENTNEIKSKYKKQSLMKDLILLIISTLPIICFSASSRIVIAYVGYSYHSNGVVEVADIQMADLLMNIYTLQYLVLIIFSLFGYYLYNKRKYKFLLLISLISFGIIISNIIPPLTDNLPMLLLLFIFGISTLISSLKGLLKK